MHKRTHYIMQHNLFYTMKKCLFVEATNLAWLRLWLPTLTLTWCYLPTNVIEINIFSIGDANQLDLVGSLYVGSVDYMDPYLQIPPAVWTATLRHGFVGCLKDLYINGASINVVAYAHEQDVGEYSKPSHWTRRKSIICWVGRRWCQ